MTWLKQSTAATVKIGPFVDSTDGVTAETGLTISQADIRLTKNGGAFAQTNNAAGATHDENGYYGVPLDATDTGTLGRLRVAVNEAGALPVWQDFMVVAANVYDSLIGGGDTLDVQVTGIGANVIDAAAIAADAITAAKVAADVTTELQTGLATSAAVATLQTSVDDLPTNAELATALGTSDDAVLAEVALVKAKTDNLPSDPADESLIIAATDAVMARLGAPVGADLSADIAAKASQASVNTIDDFLDTEVAAIKAKTDSLNFTVAGQVDANIQYVNDVAVTGTGAVGDEWGP